MAFLDMHCPGGSSSQTGTAVSARYALVNIISCGGISDVPALLEVNDGPYVIPIWNSNQGEIEASEYVWDLIQEAKIKIFDIWPKSIEFWFVVKKGKSKKYGYVGSVGVAGTQCSDFWLSKEVELKSYDLTTKALKAFKAGAYLDGVLVAPGQCENDDRYEIVTKRTANDNNFTSFVTLIPYHSKAKTARAATSWLTGVTMGSLSSTSLGETQVSFFEQVFSTSLNLEDIPKLIFVFKRIERIGLLFEGEKFSSGDFLDAEELEAGEIVVHEDVGELDLSYTQELDKLISQEFSGLKQADFILHYGKNTYLFACPVLGMYTHGYNEATVEPVVRLYIDKMFEFIDSGAKCSKKQITFFNRYKSEWEKKRSDFIEFTII